MKPLSVGNVVSTGLRIYRDNFKKYYYLALIGSLWGLIPIYGWARFYAYQGLISRLAYGEVIEQPESVQDANRFVKGRMWSFLGAAILVFLRFVLAYILGASAFFVVKRILSVVIPLVILYVLDILVYYAMATWALISVYVLTYITIFVPLIAYLIRLSASFSASELLLSTEENVNAFKSLKKSQELTKGYLKNLILIYFVASLVSFPLFALIVILRVLPEFIQESYPFLSTGIFTIIQLVFESITTALILPFWQAIKAVIYYDLKVCRQGMGLDLRK